jgi:pantothenate kinase
LLVNGLPVEAVVDRHVIDDVLLPRLEEVSAASRQRRTYVFLAAPPATGKSVLAALLAHQGRHLGLDAVGIDGFHYPNDHLASRYVDAPSGRVPLSRFKGAPDTFDTTALEQCLAAGLDHDVVDWPGYDRTLHDVVPGAHRVDAAVVLVEGNWLLLDDPRWSPLTRYSSFNVFIDAAPSLLRDRLIDRKMRGGASRAAAEEFYERSDRRNIELARTRTVRSKVDLLLRLHPDGSISQGDSTHE